MLILKYLLMFVVGCVFFWLILTLISMAIIVPRLSRYQIQKLPPYPHLFLLYPLFLIAEHFPRFRDQIEGFTAFILNKLYFL